MNINLKTTGEKSFEGVCPACHEHTQAGDSCCGEGAYVEGALISDEEALTTKEDPCVAIRLLTDAPEDKAQRLHAQLFAMGIPSTMFSGTYEGQEECPPFTHNGKIYRPSVPKYKGWNVNVFVPVSSLPTREGK